MSNWSKFGTTISGLVNNDKMGYSIALNGDATVFVVGSKQFNNRKGKVWVYKYDETLGWTAKGSSIEGTLNLGEFGHSVAISDNGNRIIIGQPAMEGVDATIRKGNAHIYNYNNSTNVWDKQITIQGNSNYNNFGISVSMSGNGNKALIGTGSSNYVKVYDYDGSTWSESQTITGVTKFGKSLSLSKDGTRFVVSNPEYTDSINKQGQISVYDYDGTTWSLQAGSTINGSIANGYFGRYVTLSDDGSTIATRTQNPVDVYVYKYNSTSGIWLPYGQTLNSEGDVRDSDMNTSANISLSEDGSVLAIGNHLNHSGFPNGKVTVYKINDSGDAWVKHDDIIADDHNVTWGREFGHSVSLSNDGSKIAIASHVDVVTGVGGLNRGSVRIFQDDSVAPIVVPEEVIPYVNNLQSVGYTLEELQHYWLENYEPGTFVTGLKFYSDDTEVDDSFVRHNLLKITFTMNGNTDFRLSNDDLRVSTANSDVHVFEAMGQTLDIEDSLDTCGNSVYVNLYDINDSVTLTKGGEDTVITKISDASYSVLWNGSTRILEEGVKYSLFGELNPNGLKFLLGGIVVDKTSRIIGTAGDPHIYPLYGNHFELPQKEAMYRLLQGENLTVNASTRKLTDEEALEIADFYEEKTGKVAPLNLITKGVVYDKIYVNNNGEKLFFDFKKANGVKNTENIVISGGKGCAINKYENSEEIKELNIDLKTKSNGLVKLKLKYFSNPQIKYGIQCNLQNTDNLSGLLIREYLCSSMKVDNMKSTKTLVGVKGKNKVKSYFNV